MVLNISLYFMTNSIQFWVGLQGCIDPVICVTDFNIQIPILVLWLPMAAFIFNADQRI